MHNKSSPSLKRLCHFPQLHEWMSFFLLLRHTGRRYTVASQHVLCWTQQANHHDLSNVCRHLVQGRFTGCLHKSSSSVPWRNWPFNSICFHFTDRSGLCLKSLTSLYIGTMPFSSGVWMFNDINIPYIAYVQCIPQSTAKWGGHPMITNQRKISHHALRWWENGTDSSAVCCSIWNEAVPNRGRRDTLCNQFCCVDPACGWLVC